MMRDLLFYLVLACVGVGCNQGVEGKNGVRYRSAVAYNDYIVGRQTILMKYIMAVGQLRDEQLDSADAYLRQDARHAGILINEIKGMPAYKGDSNLRDAAARSFAFYKRIFENEYVDLFRIRKKGQANITPFDVEEANKILDRIGKEEEKYDDAFREAQEDFARKNNMKLTDNKIQEEVDKLKKQ